MDAKKAIVDDAATWTQAVFMALPLLAYGLVYCFRLSTYRRLGVSPTLIFVRFEDVLFLIAVLVFSMSSFITSWVVEVVFSKNRRETLLRFAQVILGLVLVVQMLLLVSIKLKAGKADLHQFMLLFCQGFFFVVWTVEWRSWVSRKHVDQGARLSKLVVCGLAACFFALLIGLYLHFHLARYQICTEDHAFIAGYDDQGRAIEKTILDIDDNGVCTLSEGYVLADVTDKELHEERFSYIEVLPKSEIVTSVSSLRLLCRRA